MKTKELSEIVKRFKKIKPSKTMPICDYVLNVGGKMTHTNLDIFMTVDTGIECEFLIAIDSLNKILSKLPKESEVGFTVQDEKILLNVVGGGTFKFPAGDIDDFPLPPGMDGAVGALSVSDISLIKRAVKYCTKDDLRPVFDNVFVGKHVVGTDLNKLCFYERENNLKRDILIASEVVPLLLDCDYVVFEGEKHITLQSQSHTITFRECGGTFPNYMAVIPQDLPSAFTVDVSQLKTVVELALLAANPVSGLVVLNFSDSGLLITSQDLDFEMSFGQLIACSKLRGDSITMGYRGKFILDVLSDCKDIATFEITDPSRATIIDGNKLLMPMMIGQ